MFCGFASLDFNTGKQVMQMHYFAIEGYKMR